jgi:serine/threonine protein phosphatase PrpC
MPLYVDTGFSSARGARHDDQSCLIVVPTQDNDLGGHGALFAVADGIVDSPVREAAARDALKALGDHYYAAPENWGLKHALEESAAVANQALHAGGEQGRVAALSALVLRRRRWAVVHAGNTRVWMMRDNEIKLLTHDHVTPRVGRAPQIDRACGLSVELGGDFLSGELTEGDVFVLTNNDTHGVLTGSSILACAVAEVSAQQIATMVSEQAMKAGGGADAVACIVRIEQLPPESREDLEEDIAALPAIAPPAVGDVVDEFRIERLVHKSSRYRLYKATDTQVGQVVALKFPNPRDADEPGFAEIFLREEWIGRRVTSAHLVRTLPLKKGRRTVLYSVMAYPSGENLAKRLARKGTLSLREAAFVGSQLLEGLSQLHNQGIIHSDVRPQNIVMDQKSGQLMLLGLGSSHVPDTDTSEITSSPSRRANFLAPELLAFNPEPTIRSDLFGAGVTLYRMLTGNYPYGKISAAGHVPRGQYIAAGTRRADVPEAVDAVLRRACALDPDDRYESAQEFADALDGAMAQQAPVAKSAAARSRPAARTGSKWNWEFAAIAGLVVVLLVYLVFALRR